jgi:hypothetical protein
MFMDVAMWEHRTFDSEFTNLTPLSLLILYKLSFTINGFPCLL